MLNTQMKQALELGNQDKILFDLPGVEMKYDELQSRLPSVEIRFAIKSCPLTPVLNCLANKGSGFDAASPNEILQAIKTGAQINKIHYGNTIKSDQQIQQAFSLGITDFVTDNMADMQAIATNAPGSHVFCRLATNGKGAVWGLSRKFGCSNTDAINILTKAKIAGLVPAGLSAHIGSQQMKAKSWVDFLTYVGETLMQLKSKGINLKYINIGGGFPAIGYMDKTGKNLTPPVDDIFAAIRDGIKKIQQQAGYPIRFMMEPGRALVADQGVIRAHVTRLTEREQMNGEKQNWLYLSCGKFNGLYETDALQYRMVFPGNNETSQVSAIVAGPTCDSDDVFNSEEHLISIPQNLKSGDPVWLLSCGAYSTSYTTQGFNGFEPLKHHFIHSADIESRIKNNTRLNELKSKLSVVSLDVEYSEVSNEY